MLARLGLGSLDELFASIPEKIRLDGLLELPPALTELELSAHFGELAAQNRSCDRMVSFLGGGCYDHFVPAVVDAIAGRSEYYTAYTPYQAEASQGTLQVGFEFQTICCQLTGLDVANASLYEGATSFVEGALMALSAAGRRRTLLVSETVHPEYRQSLATYLANSDAEIALVPARNGVTDAEAFARRLGEDVAATLVQSPNFFGAIEPIDRLSALAKAAGAATIQSFDPISLGILKRPGDMGVDVATAEGQSLGTPMSFGGPFLGIFTCRESFVRRIPGRVVGETVDRQGQRCFVLTLQTREQHIRREKATSNICTNAALMALGAAVYLATLGRSGMAQVARLCYQKSRYAAGRIREVAGLPVNPHAPRRPYFREFVVPLDRPVAEVNRVLLEEHRILGGYDLGQDYPSLQGHMLVAVTEMNTREEIDRLARALKAACR